MENYTRLGVALSRSYDAATVTATFGSHGPAIWPSTEPDSDLPDFKLNVDCYVVLVVSVFQPQGQAHSGRLLSQSDQAAERRCCRAQDLARHYDATDNDAPDNDDFGCDYGCGY